DEAAARLRARGRHGRELSPVRAGLHRHQWRPQWRDAAPHVRGLSGGLRISQSRPLARDLDHHPRNHPGDRPDRAQAVPVGRRGPRMKASAARSAVRYGALVLVATILLLPIYWLIMSSFRPAED